MRDARLLLTLTPILIGCLVLFTPPFKPSKYQTTLQHQHTIRLLQTTTTTRTGMQLPSLLLLLTLSPFHSDAFSPPVSSVSTGRVNTKSRHETCHSRMKAASSMAGEYDDEISNTKKRLNKDFLGISAPALIQLAAEPLAGLVDSVWLGRMGPEVLGGAGVAISAQYAVSKLYNDPLLRTSISLVAAQDGKARSNSSSISEDEAKKELSIAVSSALLLAFVVGAFQMVIYATFASGIIKGMGVTSSSTMWHSALSYLRMRAFGTPAATLWLVTNGIFRGLGDTKTPLFYSLFFTALNAVLDPLFIFNFGFGASGAALGTLVAQYAALIPLTMALNKKVKIDVWGQMRDLKSTLATYLEAGTLVFVRTVGKVLAYSVCARQTAIMGPVSAAAYNLTFQLGFATTQICESIAVAVQTLLAREIADDKSRPAIVRQKAVRHLINGSIFAGGIVATLLSTVTFLKRQSVMKGLTNNVAVQDAALAIFPAVLATQILKGLAYPVNGISMGGLDWKFTMVSMWIANFICVGMIKFGGTMTLNKIWWALAAFMATQVIAGIVRVESKTGVWKLLKGESK